MRNNPLLYLLNTGWQNAGKYKPSLLFCFFLFVCATAIDLAEPYIIGLLINKVQSYASAKISMSQMLSEATMYLGLFLFCKFAFWAFHGPARLLERFVSFQIHNNYKASIFQMLTELPLKWHRDHHSGDSIDKLNRAATALGTFFEDSFEVSYMVLGFSGSLIVLFCYMPQAGAMAFIATLIALSTIVLFDKILNGQYAKLNRFQNSVASTVHDYVSNITSVITLRLESKVLGQVKKRLEAPLLLYKESNNLNELKYFFTSVATGTMTVVVLYWYITSTVQSGAAVQGGTLFTLFEYLQKIGISFFNFAHIYGNIIRKSADLRSAEPLIDDHKHLAQTHGDHKLPLNWQTLEIRHLFFSHEDERHIVHHIDDISINLSRKSKIAFVGESGSGKSTLLNLLRGVQQTESVELFCDGKQLKSGLSHLAAHATLIPQDPEIFSDTIRFNISFGLDADDQSILEAITMARFDSVLPRLAKGLDTNIAEKGVNLSGGEKQRLALARGLFFARESEIILLDEPTSNLDQTNEKMIYENIFRQFADKCIISSVHKLHLLESFDLIYVFSQGKLIEQGSLSELLKKPEGYLANIWFHKTETDLED
ncbi:MAG: ABC transporter ATP-binding protein/permease [Candidatus Obscuribacterales bacterium]|nr:ABC transporter ATP-binding protein/permease [Candidatus Obscuribacterales bacterium]